MQCFNSAVNVDPTFGSAFASLSYAHVVNFIRGFTESPAAELGAAYENASKAMQLDKDDALAHWSLGAVYAFRRNYSAWLEEQSVAISLNPSFAPAYAQYGLGLVATGRDDEAWTYFDQADRVSPKDPLAWMTSFGRAIGHYNLGHFAEAAAWAQKTIVSSNSLIWAHTYLAAALAKSGETDAATDALADLFRIKRDFSFAFLENTAPIDATRRAMLADGLRRAGLKQ
jgi:tetratricopeptide (TPR) repeat protein